MGTGGGGVGREGEVEHLDQLEREQLEARVGKVSAGLTVKAARFAEEVAGGATKAAAARAAGLSHRGGAPWRVLGRPEVAELVALLRERARRDAQVTLEGQIRRFQSIGRRAEEAGELAVVVAAEREVGKLSNLYPKEQQQVLLGAGAVQVLVVNTGLPPRDGAPALLPAAVDVAPLVKTEKVELDEDLSDVLC